MTCWLLARRARGNAKGERQSRRVGPADIGRFSGGDKGAKHRLGNPSAAGRAGRPRLAAMVLVNLISNAVKFTGHRAEAKIEIGCAPASQTTANPTSDLRSRQRRGFRSEICHKLFGVFQRLHSSPSSRARASGWRMSSASFTGTAAGSGRKAWWTAARHFIFQSQNNRRHK
jgi:hypothetical protein